LLAQAEIDGKVEPSLQHYLNHDYLPHVLTMMTLELRKMDADQVVANNENLRHRLKKVESLSIVDESNRH
jgi:ribosomal protein L30/L7E